MMCHVYDHPVIANCVVEYLDSCSTVIYTHLARLFLELASHSHLSMTQLDLLNYYEIKVDFS